MKFLRSQNRIQVTCDASGVIFLDPYTLRVNIQPTEREHYDNIKGATHFTVGYSNVLVNDTPFAGTLWSVSVVWETPSFAVFIFTLPLPTGSPIKTISFTMELTSQYKRTGITMLLEPRLVQVSSQAPITDVQVQVHESLVEYLQQNYPVHLVGIPAFIPGIPSISELHTYGILVKIQRIELLEGSGFRFHIHPVENPIRMWCIQAYPRTALTRSEMVMTVPTHSNGPRNDVWLSLFSLCFAIVVVTVLGIFQSSRFKSES